MVVSSAVKVRQLRIHYTHSPTCAFQPPRSVLDGLHLSRAGVLVLCSVERRARPRSGKKRSLFIFQVKNATIPSLIYEHHNVLSPPLGPPPRRHVPAGYIRERDTFNPMVADLYRCLESDGFVVVPALEVGNIEAKRSKLATLVRKDKRKPLRRDNFRGRKISRENLRLQAIADDFHGADKSEWLKVSRELGEDICAVLTALFGDIDAQYEVRQPATLFSAGTSVCDVLAERGKGGGGSSSPSWGSQERVARFRLSGGIRGRYEATCLSWVTRGARSSYRP